MCSLPSVEIGVFSPDGIREVAIRAMLDACAERSFCSPELLDMIGASGKEKHVRIGTVISRTPTVAREVCLNVAPLIGRRKKKKTRMIKQVYAVKEFPKLVSQSISTEKYPHLAGVEQGKPGKVMMIIGQNARDSLIPKQVIRGGPDEPYAVRTDFGWIINGLAYESEDENGDIHITFCNLTTMMPMPSQIMNHFAATTDTYSSEEVSLEKRCQLFWRLTWSRPLLTRRKCSFEVKHPYYIY